MTNYYSERVSILERAARYLSAMPPAISGSRGHDATFAAAQAVSNGFALDERTALAMLILHYNQRCFPPWTEEELSHKVTSALANPGDRPRGCLLRTKGAWSSGRLPNFARAAVSVAHEQAPDESARMAAFAREQLPHILSSFPWSASQIFSDSPSVMQDDPKNDWRLPLKLFHPHEIVWIGDVKESGGIQHAKHFRSAGQWLIEISCPRGPLILPAALKRGIWSRKKEDVERVPFLVVESDSLSKDEIGAVFRWLRESVGLPLCAVVDTGSRSLHGWFARPGPETVRELRAVLPALECDGAVLRDTQPVRLPGCLRPDKGTQQALLYFDPEAANE